MKNRADLSRLDASKGGIPGTKVNKNREALFVYDRTEYTEKRRLKDWLEETITDLDVDLIDCITITVKDRTW